MIKLTETATHIKLLAGSDTKSKQDILYLRNHFKFKPPDYWRSPQYILFKQSKGKVGWDGYLHPLQIRKGVMGLMKRGYVYDLIRTCRDEDIDLDSSGMLARPFSSLVLDDIPAGVLPGAPFELDDRQRHCILAWLRQVIGINKVTVSGGKTALFSAVAAIIKAKYPKARFLYVTPTERLVRQVFMETSKFLPDWHISQYGGGKKDDSGVDMVVATSAMIWKNFDDNQKFLQTFMGLLFDESQYSASPSNEKICLAVPAYFRFAASDTMKEDDEVKRNKIKGLFGDILHEVGVAPLIQEGRVAKPHIYLARVDSWHNKFSEYSHVAEPDTPCWSYIDKAWHKGVYLGPVFEKDEFGDFKTDIKGNMKQVIGKHSIMLGEDEIEVESRWCLMHRLYDKAIIQNKERNKLICDWAEYYTDLGWPTLIVCTRTLHVLILEKMIGGRIGNDKVRSLFSHHTSKERDETFEWFKNTEGACLVTPLVKVGVSINEIKAGIVADYVADWEFGNQIIGRFIRKKIEGQDNEAHITWIMDNTHPNYRKGSNQIIKKLGKIDGYSWYRPVSTPDTIKNAKHYDHIV